MPWDAYDDMQANRRWGRRGRSDDSSGDSEDEQLEPSEPLTPIHLSRPQSAPVLVVPPVVEWPPTDIYLGTVRSGQALVQVIPTPGLVVVHRAGSAVQTFCRRDHLSIRIPAEKVTPGTVIEEALEVSFASASCVIRLFGSVAARAPEPPVLNQPFRETPTDYSPLARVMDVGPTRKRDWALYLLLLLIMACIGGLIMLVALTRS